MNFIKILEERIANHHRRLIIKKKLLISITILLLVSNISYGMINISDTITWGEDNYRSNSINVIFDPIELISFNVNYTYTKIGKEDKEDKYNFGLSIYLPVRLSIDCGYQTFKDNKDYNVKGYNTKLLYEMSINENVDLGFGVGYYEIKHNKLYKSKEYELEESSKDASLDVTFSNTLFSFIYTTFDYNKDLKKIGNIILKRRPRLADILSSFASDTFRMELSQSFFEDRLLIAVSGLRIRYKLVNKPANLYLIGLTYQINPHLSLNADYERFYDTNAERAEYYSCGLGYKF